MSNQPSYSGKNYVQAMVNQTPRYDNQVRKGKRKKKNVRADQRPRDYYR